MTSQYWTTAINQIDKLLKDYGRDKVIDYINNRMSPSNAMALAEQLGCKIDGAEIVAAIEYAKSLPGKFVEINGYLLEILDYAPQTNVVIVNPSPMFTPEQRVGRDHVRQGFKLDGIEAKLVDTPEVVSFDWFNPAVQQVIRRAKTANISKIEASHVAQSKTLMEVAIYFVKYYKGSFDFILSLQRNLVRWQSLTNAQAAGALNTMLRDYDRQQSAKPPFKMPEASLPATLRAVDEKLETCVWCNVQLPVSQLVFDSIHGWVCTSRKECRDRQRSQVVQMPEGDTLDTNGLRVVTPIAHNGTYTIVLDETGLYRTIRLVDCPDTMNKPAGTQIAQYLSGSDNESNYTGFAFVSGSKVGIWSKFKGDSVLAKALNVLLTSDKEQQIDYGQAYAIESGKCWRCGRKLTVPASINRGLGPICADKL